MPQFDIWIPWGQWAFLPPALGEYPTVVLLSLLTLGLLVRSRRDFVPAKRLASLLAFLAAATVINGLLVVGASSGALLPPPGVPAEPTHRLVPLLAAVPAAIAGAWLGAGPALVVGLATGVMRALWVPIGILDPFYYAYYGYLAGSLLRQGYRGLAPAIGRQPVIALALSAVLPLPIWWVSAFLPVYGSGLAALDYATATLVSHIVPLLLQSACAAFILHAIYLVFPRLRPVRTVSGYPPYTRTLSRRLTSLAGVLALVATVVFIVLATRATLRVVTEGAVDGMARDARLATEGISYFVRTGQGLLTTFADNDVLQSGTDAAELERQLTTDLRGAAFYSQLIVFGLDGLPLGGYPGPGQGGSPEATPEEASLVTRVLQTGAPQVSQVHRSSHGEPMVSFLTPVSGAAGDVVGVLVGRVRLDANPVVSQILTTLTGVRPLGSGFVVDADGRVVLHPQPEMLLTDWQLSEQVAGATNASAGVALESRHLTSNARELVYYLPAEDFPWAAAVVLPYSAVLKDVARIVVPLVLVEVLLAGGLVVGVALAAGSAAKPLVQVAEAAEVCAEGDLSQPVRAPGNDEIARTGEAIERMRSRMKLRLESVESMLQISRSAAGTLDPARGMASVLEGALRATDARVARMVLLEAGDHPAVIARGAPREGLDEVDAAFVQAVRSSAQPVVVAGLEDTDEELAVRFEESGLESAIAVPLQIKALVVGVMWLGYVDPLSAVESEVALLTPIASQAASLLDTMRLYEATEDSRRHLAAALDATADGIVVSDQRERLLWANSAAEKMLSISTAQAVGRAAADLAPQGALKAAFTEELPADGALAHEALLPDGRTLHVNVVSIHSGDGEYLGRVATLSDVTGFKRSREEQSEFLSTVLHDLRAPLTFVQGYATMLPMVGDINEKQQDYLERIQHGVELMSDLIGALLDLTQIESGVGLNRAPCHLGGILVEAVDAMRARAASKGLTLRLEPAARMTTIEGDPALLRQAVSNLLDNAVKFTPSGGFVSVGMSVDGDQALVNVTDTGIGIAPEDRERVFDKFYRARGRDGTNVPGAGLGLAIVKSIVEHHGGRVWVESDLDRGSTFWISLPLSAPPRTERGAPLPTPAP